MQLEGITIILTSKNVPSDIIGNVIFCSDILLSHYVDKLYEHRAFEIVEICTEMIVLILYQIQISYIYLINLIESLEKKFVCIIL